MWSDLSRDMRPSVKALYKLPSKSVPGNRAFYLDRVRRKEP